MYYRDRDAVLRRGNHLKKCGIQVTEDLSKTVREQRNHLSRYQLKLKIKMTLLEAFDPLSFWALEL